MKMLRIGMLSVAEGYALVHWKCPHCGAGSEKLLTVVSEYVTSEDVRVRREVRWHECPVARRRWRVGYKHEDDASTVS